MPKIKTVKDVHPYGTLTFAEVIQKSSNIGALKAAQRLSSPRQGDPSLGFGQGIRRARETGIHRALPQPADASGEKQFA